MWSAVPSCGDSSPAGGPGRLLLASWRRSPWPLSRSRVGVGAGSAEPRNRRAPLRTLALRGGVTAIGVLLVTLVTATAASAQSADLAITVADSPDPVAITGILTYTLTVTNNGPDAATNAVVSLVTPLDTIF